MRSWIDLIESLDTPQSWSWHRTMWDEAAANFFTPSNRQVIVEFRGRTTVLINFEVESASTITGGGEAREIFSTVLDIIRDFISKRPHVRTLTFASSAFEPSRVKLYSTMMRILSHQLDSFEYKEIEDDDEDVQFWLSKKPLQSVKMLSESNRWANLYWFWYHAANNRLVHVDGTHSTIAAYELGFMPSDPNNNIDLDDEEVITKAIQAGWVRGRYGNTEYDGSWEYLGDISRSSKRELSLQGQPANVLKCAREIRKRRRIDHLFLDFDTGAEMESMVLIGPALEHYLETGEIDRAENLR